VASKLARGLVFCCILPFGCEPGGGGTGTASQPDQSATDQSDTETASTADLPVTPDATPAEVTPPPETQTQETSPPDVPVDGGGPKIPVPDPGNDPSEFKDWHAGPSHFSPETAQPMGIVTSASDPDQNYLGAGGANDGNGAWVFKAGESFVFKAYPWETSTLLGMHLHHVDGSPPALTLGSEVEPTAPVGKPDWDGNWNVVEGQIYVLEVVAKAFF
jgi:hypothetical protein